MAYVTKLETEDQSQTSASDWLTSLTVLKSTNVIIQFSDWFLISILQL
jgi:hypothetical protein